VCDDDGVSGVNLRGREDASLPFFIFSTNANLFVAPMINPDCLPLPDDAFLQGSRFAGPVGLTHLQ
jgi:hypothetical protein